MEKTDEIHNQSRLRVEKELEGKKKQLVKDLTDLFSKCSVVKGWQDLKIYKIVLPKLKDLHEELEVLKEKKQEISTEEFLLFNSKSEFP